MIFEILFPPVFSDSLWKLQTKFRKKEKRLLYVLWWVCCEISLVEETVVKVHRIVQSKCKVTGHLPKTVCTLSADMFIGLYLKTQNWHLFLYLLFETAWVVILRVLNYYSMSHSQEVFGLNTYFIFSLSNRIKLIAFRSLEEHRYDAFAERQG